MKKIIVVISILCLSVSAFGQDLTGGIYVSNQIESNDPADVVREYVVGEVAYCAVYAKGAAKDSSGNIDLSLDMQFLDPKNNILFEKKDYAKPILKTQDNKEYILFDRSFDVYFTPEDILGMYTIVMTITDNVAKTEYIAKITLLLFDTEESKKLITQDATSAKQLDDLWAEYFRSKNPWAVKTIIRALRLINHPGLDQTLVGRAAKWSLKSNAQQHPEVAEICKQTLEYTNGEIRKHLTEIINNLKESQ